MFSDPQPEILEKCAEKHVDREKLLSVGASVGFDGTFMWRNFQLFGTLIEKLSDFERNKKCWILAKRFRPGTQNCISCASRIVSVKSALCEKQSFLGPCATFFVTSLKNFVSLVKSAFYGVPAQSFDGKSLLSTNF